MSYLTDQQLDSGALNDRLRRIALSKVGNLLTDNQAKPTTVGAWTLGNATEGAAGVFTATVTTDMSVRANVPVVGDETYTLAVMATTPANRVFGPAIGWKDAAGNYIGSVLFGSPRFSASSTGTAYVTAKAPDNAVTADIFPFYSTPGAVGDVLILRSVSFHKGTPSPIWQPPGVPAVGQSPIRYDGSYDLSGSGSPEGKVSAPKGSTYTQSDHPVAGGGILVWRKTTSSGTTGWVVESGDTDFLDISGRLHADWELASAGFARARRRDGTVTVALRIRRKTAGGSRTAGSDIFASAMPTGFTPANGYVTRAYGFPVGGSPMYVYDSNFAGLFQAFGLAAGTWAVGDPCYVEFDYACSGAWPTAAPV